MLEQDRLDVDRGDVLAAPANPVLDPIDEPQVSLGVEPRRVSRVEPEVPERLEGPLRHPEIPLGRGPREERADEQLSHLAGSDVLLVGVDDAGRVQVGIDASHRALGRIERPAGDHAYLGAPVGRDDLFEAEPIAEGGREVRRARDRPGAPEPRVRILRPLRLLEDEGQHDAEQRGVRRPARTHAIEPRRGREPLLDPDARPDEQGAVDAHLGVDVEERQLGEVRVAGAEIEELTVALREEVQVGVREDRALRRSGGTRREVDRSDIRRGDDDVRAGGGVAIEERRVRNRLETRHCDRRADHDDGAQMLEARGRGRHCIEEHVLDDEHTRGGGVDEMLEERSAVVDVHRHLHCAELRRAEPRDDELCAIAHHQENTIAVPDAEAGEARGGDVRRGRGLGVGELALAQGERQERPVGMRARLRREQLRQAPVGTIGNGERHAYVASIPARIR